MGLISLDLVNHQVILAISLRLAFTKTGFLHLKVKLPSVHWILLKKKKQAPVGVYRKLVLLQNIEKKIVKIIKPEK